MAVIIDATTGIDKVQDNVIVTNDIVNGAVTGVKIADGAVTSAKLASGVAGTGPAFSVALAGTQAISAGVATKLVWDTEEYDTSNCFASNRFTPNVAGYYQINFSIYTAVTSANQNVSAYKNGVLYKQMSYQPSGSEWLMFGQSLLVYMNGSTDYLELYVTMQNGGTVGNNAGVAVNYFQGYLARAA